MSEIGDLRSTLGWRLCDHARDSARKRGVTVREVLEAIQSPDLVEAAFSWGPGRYTYKHRDLEVVVVPATKWVITILWNNPARWTDEEFRAARLEASAA
ncbi:MAG: DUF4258 domain-containing protein [Rhodoglobus sp.]|uniref:DUF4258 domain-containing protein n=1 Tax=Pengzhenrongella phosphoraccumulans TaxID=3114394 RepID=UPI00388CFA15